MKATHRPISRDTTLTLLTQQRTDLGDDWDEYLLRFWLPIIGPTPFATRQRALHHLDTCAERTTNGQLIATINAGELAQALGTGIEPFADNLWRARRHGFWHHNDTETGECVWEIPRTVPVLSERVVGRRDSTFRAAHAAYLAGCSTD